LNKSEDLPTVGDAKISGRTFTFKAPARDDVYYWCCYNLPGEHWLATPGSNNTIIFRIFDDCAWIKFWMKWGAES